MLPKKQQTKRETSNPEQSISKRTKTSLQSSPIVG